MRSWATELPPSPAPCVCESVCACVRARVRGVCACVNACARACLCVCACATTHQPSHAHAHMRAQARTHHPRRPARRNMLLDLAGVGAAAPPRGRALNCPPHRTPPSCSLHARVASAHTCTNLSLSWSASAPPTEPACAFSLASSSTGTCVATTLSTTLRAILNAPTKPAYAPGAWPASSSSWGARPVWPAHDRVCVRTCARARAFVSVCARARACSHASARRDERPSLLQVDQLVHAHAR